MVSSPSSADASGDSWPGDTPPEHEYRVLILAPTGNDARLTAEFLAAAAVETAVVANVPELCRQILAGCGTVLIAEEVMTSSAATQLFDLLKHQPTWSDLPVTLITTGGAAGLERMRRIAAFGTYGNVSVLERPFRPATLVSTLEVALRSRRRQYQVRKLLVELSQARDAAERASRAKDEFLAALSHELRTPLNPVLLLASESAADPTLPLTVRRDFDQIARNVMLEARLIDDLLDLTRITQGKLRLELRAVGAHAALRAALETTQQEIGEKQLAVELDWQAEHDTILADPVRLQQIFWNVLKNAAKFTPAGGRIQVVTASEENKFTIRVADNGVGMDEVELTRVFDAFVQGNHSRSQNGHRFGGLGLGLAISRRLMELHGGVITAHSDGPGTGSTFTLVFPLVKQSLHVTETDGIPPFLAVNSGSDRRRLLLVEDHAATRVSLQRLLEHRGYRVAAVASLAEARQVANSERFDLLLSDIGLPDGNGYELMSELRQKWGLPGIALSGYGMEADLVLSKNAGFVEHLTKPVSIHALDTALAGVERMHVGSRNER